MVHSHYIFAPKLRKVSWSLTKRSVFAVYVAAGRQVETKHHLYSRGRDPILLTMHECRYGQIHELLPMQVLPIPKQKSGGIFTQGVYEVR